MNSSVTGLANLRNVLGVEPLDVMRDWALALFTDDNAAGSDPRFQLPSWNLRDVMLRGSPQLASQYPPATRSLTDNRTTVLVLAAGGAQFLRFNVPAGQEALLTVTASGLALPSNIRLSLVRVR